MKKSKQANASLHEDNVDRISSLPDPILHLILSRIPSTEEVIRTSILSTRWRYLWTSLPSIDIDCSRVSKFERNKFKKFVNHVLAINSLDLDSFRLSCTESYSMKIVKQWIQSAVMRNIKQLSLLFCPGSWLERIELSECLVNCDSLQVLQLGLYGWHKTLSDLTWFPKLRVLELNHVELSHKSNFLKDFLKSCPLLEDLSLIDCEIKKLKLLCISCPKLKNLRMDNRNIFDPDIMFDLHNLCGGIQIVCPNLEAFEFGAFLAQKYIFESLGLLKKAVIHSDECPMQFMDYSWLFGGVSHLESLSTSIDILCFNLCLSDGFPSLSNLKTLKLIAALEEDNSNMSKFIEFLTCHPHLESLHLIIEEDYFIWEYWKLDEEETRSILTCHLKKVEFLNFYNEKLLVDIACSLLEHGNALEEMVFRWDCDESEFHEMSMETMNQVSTFQKASSNVKLISLNEISYYLLSSKP